MGIIEILLTSFGLAMDAFAVSICKGLSMKKYDIKKGLIIGLYFGLFQGLMPLIGYILGVVLHKADFITPNGAILVDDHLPNLEYWFEKGGIPILFSKKYKSCQFENITDLLELFSKNKIKVREQRRYNEVNKCKGSK